MSSNAANFPSDAAAASAPSHHHHGTPSDPPAGANTVLDNETFKIAGSSNVKLLAGAIAKRIREGHPVKLAALGAASVNQAVKALAISRNFLVQDRFDILILPEFIHIHDQRHNDPQRSALRFNVIVHPSDGVAVRKSDDRDTDNELKVARGTSATSAAGAIAKRVRERHECVITAIGAEAVNQAAKAVAIARSYLEEDGLDIHFVPRFVYIEVQPNEVKSALELEISLTNQ